MTQEIKDLIEKINREGIEAAENSARKIEEAAKKEAAQILERAKKETEKLIAEAKADIQLMEEKQRSLLNQAGRDLLLSLRSEINSMLDKVIRTHIRSALTPQELIFLIAQVTKSAGSAHKQDIIVTLNNEDYLTLEKHFMSALKEEVKRGVVLKPSPDILAGFHISFDSGKSQFDFSDAALAEYIGIYLKPKLAQILGPQPNK